MFQAIENVITSKLSVSFVSWRLLSVFNLFRVTCAWNYLSSCCITSLNATIIPNRHRFINAQPKSRFTPLKRSPKQATQPIVSNNMNTGQYNRNELFIIGLFANKCYIWSSAGISYEYIDPKDLVKTLDFSRNSKKWYIFNHGWSEAIEHVHKKYK